MDRAALQPPFLFVNEFYRVKIANSAISISSIQANRISARASNKEESKKHFRANYALSDTGRYTPF